MLDSICTNELGDPDELVATEATLSEIQHRCCPKDRSLADWYCLNPYPYLCLCLCLYLYLQVPVQGVWVSVAAWPLAIQRHARHSTSTPRVLARLKMGRRAEVACGREEGRKT